jgi:tetratricopeptide (TPR) repeat protein
MSTQKPLNIFVAMPGTSMGDKALWQSPEQIKNYFLQPICDRLKEALDREVVLVIEKDKDAAGAIYRSMYQEAWNAEVYIADLTGANANVYLELGVRWAARDRITILVCQDLSEIRFNVAASRAIQYGMNPAVNETGIDKVVRAVLYGLAHEEHCDSPVRDGAPLKTITVDEYEGLQQEIKRLRGERGEELLDAARKAADNRVKIDFLRQAAAVNPASLEAHLELGIVYRVVGEYGEAAAALRKAIQLRPDCAPCHRELGVALSKAGQLDAAADALRAALELEPKDYEALSVLGGVYRKLGMRDAPGEFHWGSLREARNCYERAGEINEHDTYPLLNVARIDLLLSKVDPGRRDAALQAFDYLQDLCSFEARKAEKAMRDGGAAARQRAYWSIFDHADTLLFSGKLEAGLARFREGVELVDPSERRSVLSSVSSPLKNYLSAGVLDGPVKSAVEALAAELDAAAGGA